MKNILKITAYICLFALAIVSCTTNEYEEPNNGAARALNIISTDLGRAGGEQRVRINDTVTFTDLSVFASSRTWTFPEGAVDIVGSTNDVTSNEPEIQVIFKTVGEVQSVLTPTFNGPVADEVSQVVTMFTVLEDIVADFTTVPAANADGIIVIEAGESITFTDASTGERNDFLWDIRERIDGEFVSIFPSEDLIPTDDEVVVPFRQLGIFNLRFVARAVAPLSFSSSAVLRLNFIRVIASTQPLTIDTIVNENSDGAIEVGFSRSLNPIEASDMGSFIVKVDGVQVPLRSVALNEDNDTVVLVTPVDNIRSSQSATIEYVPGNVQGIDGSPAPALAETSVNLFVNQLITNGDFETGDLSGFSGNADNFTVTTERAFAGDYSLRFEANVSTDIGAFVELRTLINDNSFVIDPTRSYRIEYQIFAEEFNVPIVNPPFAQINTRVLPDDGTFRDNPKLFYRLDNPPSRMQWSNRSRTFNPGELQAGDLGLFIRFQLFGTRGVYFLDDIKLTEIE